MEASRKGRVLGLNHVALEVGDVNEALRFYGELFELRLRGRRGDQMAFVDLGDQFIALARGTGEPAGSERHFGLVVDDREALRGTLRERGLLHGGRGVRFTDPWGNVVEVVDYRDVQYAKRDEVLRAMGARDPGKRDGALAELRDKGVDVGGYARAGEGARGS